MSWYRSGTVSVVAGSKVVAGTGTDFITYVTPGAIFFGPDGRAYEVDTITAAGSMSLVTSYAGAAANNAAYSVAPTQAYIVALAQQVASLLGTFSGFRDDYLAGNLVGAGLELKGILASPAQLPATGNSEGDAYMIAAVLYVWAKGAWQSGSIQGPKGDVGDANPLTLQAAVDAQAAKVAAAASALTASNSAATALTSQTSAAGSATAAAANLATARNAYYGSYASDPATRPDASARQAGDRYYNSVAKEERTFNGTIWYVPNLSAAGLAAPGGGGQVGNTPAGGVTATTQQGAINELDTKKAARNGDSTQNFAVASLNGGPVVGLNNKLINGNMSIDQRNNGGSVNIAAGASAYVLDCWLIINSTNQTVTVQQTATTFDGSDVHRRMRVSFAIAPTTGAVFVAQRVEGADTLAGQTATASFHVATAEAALVSTIYTLQNFGSGGSAAVSQTPVGFTPNNTISRYSGNFAMPSIVGKTVGAGSYVECGVSFTVRSTSAITITDAQFEIGSVATLFDKRPIGFETMLCQRYAQKVTWAVRDDTANATARLTVTQTYVVPMRVTPTAINLAPGTVVGMSGLNIFPGVYGFRAEGVKTAAGDCYVLDRVDLLTAGL
jgi:hypothetical protein